MHRFSVRVYYEDTDMAGIVYHANHLKFIERARSEALRQAGVDQNAMRAEGLVFVVRSMRCDWLAPARYEDVLEVSTEAGAVKRASATLIQTVRREGAALFRAEVLIACMDEAGAPRRLPEAAAAALQGLRGA